MDKEIVFNGRKYRPVFIGGYWRHRSTTDPRTYLARDMVKLIRGITLTSMDVVHHIDGDSLNDEISNLSVLLCGVHSSNHLTDIVRSDETRRRISVGKSKPNLVRSQNILGKNNPNWKGGNSNSYKYRKVGL